MAVNNCTALIPYVPPEVALGLQPPALKAPFVSPMSKSLNDALTNHVYSFLGPEDLSAITAAGRAHSAFARRSNQWRAQCQTRLNIGNREPMDFLPVGCPSYIAGARIATPKVYDASVYQRLLGASVGAVPPIPPEISLDRRNDPDRCGPGTIGRNYTWIWFPETVNFAGENIPVTIENLPLIFAYPRIGHPSKYNYIWESIREQHGEARSPSRWVCIRDEVIARSRTYDEQLAAAKAAGALPTSLQERL